MANSSLRRKINTLLQNPHRWAVILLACLPILFTTLYTQAYLRRVAFGDQWQPSLEIAREVKNGTLSPADLMQVHGGHWHFFSNASTAIFTALDNWNLTYDTYLNLVLALIAYGLLVYVFWRQHPHLTMLVILPFSALVFHLAQEKNWILSYFGMWHYASIAVFGAFAVLISTRPGWRPLLIIAALTLCAHLALATGAALWVAMPLAMWLWGYRRPENFGAWFLLASIIMVIYLTAVQNTPSSAASGTTEVQLASPDKIIEFLLLYFAAPLVRYRNTLAMLVTISGLSLWALNTWLCWRRDGNQSIVVWAVLPIYAGGAGIAISFGRLEALGVGMAYRDRYIAAGGLLWISLFALMAINLAHAPRWLNTLNAIAAVIIAGLYLHNVLVFMQDQARLFEYEFTSRNTGYTAYENCVLDYPLTRTDEGVCRVIHEFPERVYTLAAYRLTLFADQPRMNVLPETYETGSPIIINSPSRWLNIYIRDMMLAGVDEAAIFHIAPPEIQVSTDTFPTPLTDVIANVSSTAPLEEFTGGAAQIWYITTPEKAEEDTIIRDLMAQRGYYMTPYPIQDTRYRLAKFSIFRFQQRPDTMQTLLTFGDEKITLQDYTLTASEPVQPCTNVRLQTWWTSEFVPEYNYSTTLVLIAPDGSSIAQKDAAIGDTLMQLWEPGQYYFDERILPIPCGIPAGEYTLALGIYLDTGSGFQDLLAFDPAGRSLGIRAPLTTIEIGD